MIYICIGGLFSPMEGAKWKKGTLKTLTRQAYTECLNDNLLQEELHYIEKCFTEINVFPKWLLKQTLDSFKTTSKEYNNKINKNNSHMNINNYSDKIVHTLKLPYKDDHSTNLIKLTKKSTKKSLPEKHVRIILNCTKLNSLSLTSKMIQINNINAIYFT